jgi:hypothetical protein
MRPLFKAATLAVALALLGLGSSVARAQGPPVYYYPAAGYYSTTAGTVYIPTPGYYYNTPATVSVQPSYAYAPAPRYRGWSYGSTIRPIRRVGGGPNNPPYYESALHSLHGRGYDSARHGR